MLDEVYVV